MKGLFLCIMSVFLMQCVAQKVSSDPMIELRGTWLTNVDSRVLESRESIAEAMQFLADHHFNVVYPVVWNKGMTLYKSPTMERLFGIPIDTLYGERDPLAEVIEEAHKRDLAVIAWFEFGFSSSYQENGGHLLKARPEWAARDIHGRLLTKNGFEWMNAYHPEVQQFLLDLIMEVAGNYQVDGVQGDDRLPAQPSEGGYSPYTVQVYQQEHGGELPPENHRDPHWLRWRANILNRFVERVYNQVKGIDAKILVTWSPSIYPWAYEEYLQDWPTWVRNGWADIIHQQNYRYSIEDYKKVVDDQSVEKLGIEKLTGLIFPGVLMNVGDYLIDEEFLLQTIAYNRRNGLNGEVFFFYEGLRRDNNRLAKRLLETYYKQPAKFPFQKRQ